MSIHSMWRKAIITLLILGISVFGILEGTVLAQYINIYPVLRQSVFHFSRSGVADDGFTNHTSHIRAEGIG